MPLRLAAVAAAAASLAVPLAAQAPRPSLAEPSLSSRGELAFASGGELWSVPLAGGEARLLVAHPATESRPLWSPDGARLAFVSNRTGNGDLYVLTVATGQLLRLTYDDAAEQLDAWSRDGEWLYFHSSARDISGMHDVHRIRSTGGTPATVAGDRYASEYFAQPSPDGRRLAITARGVVAGQWWRHGHSHLDESELWLVTLGAVPSYRRVGEAGGAKDAWPLWSPDGATLYYLSDRGGHENLWARPVAGGAGKPLTRFTSGRVLWPQLSPDGRTIVFERDFGIWAYDVAGGQARAVPITLRGAVAGRATERVAVSANWQGVALAPDGKKLALVTRGELFASGTKDGDEARRVTRSVLPDGQPAWTRDAKTLLFVPWRGDVAPIVAVDVASGAETVLAATGENASPVPSPDGKWVAFTRDGAELRVVGIDGKGERLLAKGIFGRAPFLGSRTIAWSPDSKWVAYLSTGTRGFTHAFVVPREGGEARQVSFLASSFSEGLQWAPDGTWLLFETAQRTEEARLVRVDLVPRAPRYRETAFTELFAEPRKDTTTKPVTIAFEGIRERATLLEPGIAVSDAVLSPDGRSLALVSSGAGQPNLYAWSLDELAKEPPVARQLTTTPGAKAFVQWSPDGKELWYTDGGRLSAVVVESRAARGVGVTAELEVDFHEEKVAAFEQAWRWLRNGFFDPRMHGADWDAIRARWAPQVAGAQTADELRRLLQLMVGELDASHLGATGSPLAPPQPVGRLGLDLERLPLEEQGEFRVAALVAHGPAALAGDVRPGDRLLRLNGVALDRATRLDSLLAGTTGKRVELVVQSGAAAPRTVALRPVALADEKQLRYRQWVEERRAYVAKASGGRLGYVHMFSMGAEALAQLHLDLDAENMGRDGVVVDVRNNNGGFVNAYALDVFARKGYLTMTRRGGIPVPARNQLGQRALEKPTVLVTNQHSLSDAEDFAEGYRALGLGPVVGEPTSGWIIYTSNVTLLDGTTTLRIPFTRVQGADGQDMEGRPRPVDVPVTRPVGESYAGTDTQLDAAVRALLARLK
ncbi:MAG: S41 family peptidase [Gemmatimonadales bacterium]|nr:S41 family peptidase [Gemmatimonadales bacterium]